MLSHCFITVVELPDLPDGKKIELRFDREGLVEASTQTTKPIKVSESSTFKPSYNGIGL